MAQNFEFQICFEKPEECLEFILNNKPKIFNKFIKDNFSLKISIKHQHFRNIERNYSKNPLLEESRKNPEDIPPPPENLLTGSGIPNPPPPPPLYLETSKTKKIKKSVSQPKKKQSSRMNLLEELALPRELRKVEKSDLSKEKEEVNSEKDFLGELKKKNKRAAKKSIYTRTVSRH